MADGDVVGELVGVLVGVEVGVGVEQKSVFIGELLSAVVLSPSCPELLRPQHCTSQPAIHAQLW